MEVLEMITAELEAGALRLARHPLVAPDGFPACSAYTDLFWTPVVGPTVVALLRWADAVLPALQGQALAYRSEVIEEALGNLNAAKLAAVMLRAIRFNLAGLDRAQDLAPTVLLRTWVPRLTEARLDRLSEKLQAHHERFVREDAEVQR